MSPGEAPPQKLSSGGQRRCPLATPRPEPSDVDPVAKISPARESKEQRIGQRW
jgi:hypothetical protein